MADPNDLTAREMEVLALAWQCMEIEPRLNIAKLAQLTGYTHASASVTFGKIKRKLKAKAAGSSASPSTPKKSAAAGATPKAKTPRTGKRATIDDAAAGTPTKKGKKAVQAADSDEDGDEMGKFLIKKEEAADVNASADAFFEEATAYAHGEV